VPVRSGGALDGGSAALASQGKHTPFLGYELAGQVQATIVAGRVAYQRA
jgi:dihydroorotase